MFPDSVQGGSEFTDVAGATAIVADRGEAAAVSWSPQPDIVVTFAAYGTPDEVLAIARSIRPVDAATREPASELNTNPGDGCGRLFLC